MKPPFGYRTRSQLRLKKPANLIERQKWLWGLHSIKDEHSIVNLQPPIESLTFAAVDLSHSSITGIGKPIGRHPKEPWYQ